MTDITLLLDRSGSMQSIKSATIEGVNKFIKDQQDVKDDDATFQLIQFDDQYETGEATPIADAKLLDGSSFLPRGWTAYYDALGKTINNIRARHAGGNVPDKVLVVIVTDGLENNSKEFKLHELRELVTSMRDLFKWEFLYLGANLDAVEEASKIGIPQHSSMTFGATQKGMTSTSATASNYATTYRSGGNLQNAITMNMRNEALGTEKWSNLGDGTYQSIPPSYSPPAADDAEEKKKLMEFFKGLGAQNDTPKQP